MAMPQHPLLPQAAQAGASSAGPAAAPEAAPAPSAAAAADPLAPVRKIPLVALIMKVPAASASASASKEADRCRRRLQDPALVALVMNVAIQRREIGAETGCLLVCV